MDNIDNEKSIVKTNTNGIHLAVNRPGEIFGWSALVEPYMYTATTKCKSAMPTCIFTIKDNF